MMLPLIHTAMLCGSGAEGRHYSRNGNFNRPSAMSGERSAYYSLAGPFDIPASTVNWGDQRAKSGISNEKKLNLLRELAQW